MFAMGSLHAMCAYFFLWCVPDLRTTFTVALHRCLFTTLTLPLPVALANVVSGVYGVVGVMTTQGNYISTS
jgi:hypothetical protein